MLLKNGRILSRKNIGKLSVNYRLRDWIFSRQRYWGEPFPIIHWEDGTIELLDEKDLPLELPKMTNLKNLVLVKVHLLMPKNG